MTALPAGVPTEIRVSPDGHTVLCLHPTNAPGDIGDPRWLLLGTQHTDGGQVTVQTVEPDVVADWTVVHRRETS